MTAPDSVAEAAALAVHLDLDLAELPARQECVVVVQTGVRIGGVRYDTAAQLIVRKTRQRPTPQGWLVELSTLDFSQEPTSDLEELAGYLAQVKEHLLVEIDRTGQLSRVLNKEELQAKWAALKPALQARYRSSAEVSGQLLDQLGTVLHEEGQLEHVLRQAPEYRLLLPAIFGRPYYTAASQPGSTILQRFLGELDLAVRTEARLAAPASAAGACTVQVVGWIDEAHYPAAGVRQAVRALTDRFDVDPALHLLYRENYGLGPAPYQGVTHAASHTRYEVPGVVGREVTALLTTLTD